jgi:hypothetical protein
VHRGLNEHAGFLPVSRRTPEKHILAAGNSGMNFQGLNESFQHEVRLLPDTFSNPSFFEGKKCIMGWKASQGI